MIINENEREKERPVTRRNIQQWKQKIEVINGMNDNSNMNNEDMDSNIILKGQ